MNAKQIEAWEKTRAMGRKRYVIQVGMLSWGIPVAIIWSLWMGYSQGWDRLPIYLPLALVLFPLGGILFGRWTWALAEKNYHAAKAKAGDV